MKTLRERLEAKIVRQGEEDGGCWLWTGSWAVRVANSSYRPRRVVWEIFKGLVPEGTNIIGVCRSEHCVRPEPKHCVPSQAKSDFKKKLEAEKELVETAVEKAAREVLKQGWKAKLEELRKGKVGFPPLTNGE